MVETAAPASAKAISGNLHVRPVTGRGLFVERRGRVLLDIAEVSFGDHKLTAIVGPNGAGKTLLVKILTGVMKPDKGLDRDGRAIRQRAPGTENCHWCCKRPCCCGGRLKPTLSSR